MRIVIFTHSLISDWNHGNAHFLRGIAGELQSRGHHLRILEPENGWSLQNLIAAHGPVAIENFQRAFPELRSQFYNLQNLNLDRELAGADLVLVHEWNSHELVQACGAYRERNPELSLLFHDTHHRTISDFDSIRKYDLRHYDGVLAFGGVIRDLYRKQQWARHAWTWHEAADTRLFYPRNGQLAGDLVWIGNWGDGERTEEIREFLIGPVKSLGLKARVYGVRYPAHALDELAQAGIEYGGWLPNYRVPEIFAQYRLTVHIPRRPYAQALPGIPTIRVFEALACGIPHISAPWSDCENLFTSGRDFLIARDGAEMTRYMALILSDKSLAGGLAANGLAAIRARHSCAHRVDQLLEIHENLKCRLPSLAPA